MNDVEIRAQLARALGRPPDQPGERRIAMIIGAVLVASGPAAEQALVAACAVYERMLERAHLAAAARAPERPPGR